MLIEILDPLPNLCPILEAYAASTTRVPMPVGVAYLIFFALEERRMRRLPPA